MGYKTASIRIRNDDEMNRKFINHFIKSLLCKVAMLVSIITRVNAILYTTAWGQVWEFWWDSRKHMNQTLEVPGFDWRRSAVSSYVLYLNNFSKE